MRIPTFLVAATVAGLAACASPDAGPTAPAPVPTPRPVPRPALVVTTAARSSANKPTPAQLSVYAIGGDGQLTVTAPPQPIGSLDRVYAASYTAASGLYRQVVSETPFGGATTLVTYAVDLATGVFSRLGSSPLPRPYGTVGLHPNGRFLYASAGSRELHGYELDPGNGALLRALPGAPFTWDAPMGLVDIRFAASGRFAWGHGRIPDGYHSNRGFVISFAVDPVTGALQTADETPFYDQQSILAVATREDSAYLVDRTVLRPGSMTWRRFSVDGAGVLDQEELWEGQYAAGLHFTASDRFLLSVGDGDSLALLERGSNGRPVKGMQIEIPRSSESDLRRTLFQVGDFLYLGGDRTLGVVRLDEPARTLTLVQQVTPGEDLEVLSVALALPAP